VFGDETSLGLAAALNRPATHLLLEVSDVAQAMPVIDYLRLDNTHVRARLDGDAHCPLLAEHLAGLLMDDPAAGIVLTCRAGAIGQMTRFLRQTAVVTGRHQTKAFWAPGKMGMD
jgi:ferric-chelate reductase (NADPH)